MFPGPLKQGEPAGRDLPPGFRVFGRCRGRFMGRVCRCELLHTELLGIRKGQRGIAAVKPRPQS